MKNLLQKSLLLLVLLSSILILGACGGSSATAPSPDAIKGLIQGDIDDVDADLTKLEGEASTATGEMAATLANNAYALKNKIVGVADTFDNDIKDGYITEEERADYDKTIDEMKSKLDTLATDLTAKAGEFASEIKPEETAIAVTTKDDLDELIEDDNKTLDNFEAGLSGATGETLNTMRGIVEDKLASVEKAIDDMDKLVSEGVITEDEKATYEKDLKKIRRRFEEIEDSIGADTASDDTAA